MVLKKLACVSVELSDVFCKFALLPGFWRLFKQMTQVGKPRPGLLERIENPVANRRVI